MSSRSKPDSAKEPVGQSDNRPPLPSGNVRTIVSLLLFMHLFSLGIVWIWQTNSSSVSVQLHNIPAGYLKPLHLDVAFDDGHPGNNSREIATNVRHRDRSRRAMLHFTHGDALDDELFLEFSYGPEDDRAMVMLPPEGIWPPPRRQRFQRIAWEIARAANHEDAREVLARVVAQSLLHRFDVDQGELRFVRRRAQTVEEANVNDPAVSDPTSDRYLQTLIAFDVHQAGSVLTLTVTAQASETNAAPASGSNAPAVDTTINNDAAPDGDTRQQRTPPRLGPVRQGGAP